MTMPVPTSASMIPATSLTRVNPPSPIWPPPEMMLSKLVRVAAEVAPVMTLLPLLLNVESAGPVQGRARDIDDQLGGVADAVHGDLAGVGDGSLAG